MADKSKTIKEATDAELDEVIKRLRKEREAQLIIADLSRGASAHNPYGDYTNDPVSTERPITDMYHFGTAGMKWGVRKSRSSSSGGQSKGKKGKTQSADSKAARKLEKKSAKKLSTAELKELNNRLQLEKQYKTLRPTMVNKGQTVVKAITAAGTTVAGLYALSKTPLAQDIKRAVASKG